MIDFFFMTSSICLLIVILFALRKASRLRKELEQAKYVDRT